MRIDADRAWTAIQKAARTNDSVSAKMAEVITACSADFPHPDWSRIACLPFQQDVATLADWMPSVLRRERPEIRIRGLWFGFLPVGVVTGTGLVRNTF